MDGRPNRNYVVWTLLNWSPLGLRTRRKQGIVQIFVELRHWKKLNSGNFVSMCVKSVMIFFVHAEV